ncbi:hypothetical protein [Terricaulis sp.]|uniref:hypothetical protein n=1 Tax=Terricaulis sp. TaxID=2768686 RepID=UPI003783042D
MKRRLALLTVSAFLAFAPAAHAQDLAWADEVEVMNEADMNEHRGGFEINGIEFNFGAVITTYVNGVPALTTTLTWTDVGTFVQETVGDIGTQFENLTPEARAAMGLPDTANGVVLTDASGVTALVHNITESSIQNIIINNASGRDLSQDIDVTLQLPGFEAMQNSLMLEHLGMQLHDEMSGLVDPGG